MRHAKEIIFETLYFLDRVFTWLSSLCWIIAVRIDPIWRDKKPYDQLVYRDEIVAAALKFYDAQGKEDLEELRGTHSTSQPVEYMELLYACEEFRGKENSYRH